MARVLLVLPPPSTALQPPEALEDMGMEDALSVRAQGLSRAPGSKCLKAVLLTSVSPTA